MATFWAGEMMTPIYIMASFDGGQEAVVMELLLASEVELDN